MKTKFYWVALLASAAMIAQAKAGGHHGGGGGGGFAMAANPAPAHAAAPAFHSASRSNFGGGRYIAPGTRASSYYGTFRQPRFVAADRTFARSRQFTTGTANRRLDGSRTVNGRETRLTRNGNDSRNRFQNRSSNVGRERVFARHSADWHRDWDRRRDHWWRGHRCHFVNGVWFIYDTGFYPYDYWYPYGYGGYYASDYYPYDYDPGIYESSGSDYYGQGAYGSSDPYADSVATVQEQLARQGYYRGEIDGIFGLDTHRAVVRYQSDHGLRMTGHLNADTRRALGLPRVASN
jgi:hypothetical protein